ncbi:MAG: sulfite exporter TauE/SafE family protein [Chloroflexi bacterium]|nr:sulfite exporter TauE/SafE family protein [Chloroflexota bacterium]
MAGVPAGTLVLLVLDASPLWLLIGIVVTTAAVAMMLGFRKALHHELAASVPIGFVSGVLGASTGLAGPPVIFFYTNQGLDPREVRANIVAHFVMMDVVTLPSFIIAGLFTDKTVLLSVQLLPATLAGVVVGIVLNRWVRQALFRRIALVLMVIAGTVAAVSGIAGL